MTPLPTPPTPLFSLPRSAEVGAIGRDTPALSVSGDPVEKHGTQIGKWDPVLEISEGKFTPSFEKGTPVLKTELDPGELKFTGALVLKHENCDAREWQWCVRVFFERNTNSVVEMLHVTIRGGASPKEVAEKLLELAAMVEATK